MPIAPTVQRHRVRTDPDLRMIGLLALAMVVAAAVASMAWTRMLDVGVVARGGDLIGATFAPADAAGVMVNSVRADGAARRGGIRVGDVIEAVDGIPLRGLGDADRALLRRRLDIRVRRGKREFDLHLDAKGEASRGQQGPVDRG